MQELTILRHKVLSAIPFNHTLEEIMIHHGAQDYPVAAKEAAEFATKKLEAIIAKGRENAQSTLEYIDSHQPKDAVVAHSALRFSPEEVTLSAGAVWDRQRKTGRIRMKFGGENLNLQGVISSL